MQPVDVSHYEPFLIEITEGEAPFENALITSVTERDNGWEVVAAGWTCLVPYLPYKTRGIGRDDREQPAPKVGDRLRLYGSFGRPIDGMQVNDFVVFYRDYAMREAKRRRDLEDYEAQKKRRFTVERQNLDRDYEALPEFFKARIDRFRSEDPAFRYDSEGYEMFCCVEAVKIAEHLAPVVLQSGQYGESLGDLITKVVKEFHDKPWEEQQQIVPGLNEGHSVNTFGGACALAAAYLRHRAGMEVSV